MKSRTVFSVLWRLEAKIKCLRFGCTKDCSAARNQMPALKWVGKANLYFLEEGCY